MMAILTWLTVIVGWVVVADQQAFRELRKDRAARVNDLRATLGQIEADAVQFHTAEHFVEADAFKLRRSIGMLSREISLLIQCRFISDSCGDAVIELRETCTDVGMEANTFKQQQHRSDLVGKIMVARQSLDDLLASALADALLCNKPISQSLKDTVLSGWESAKPLRAGVAERAKQLKGMFRDSGD